QGLWRRGARQRGACECSCWRKTKNSEKSCVSPAAGAATLPMRSLTNALFWHTTVPESSFCIHLLINLELRTRLIFLSCWACHSKLRLTSELSQRHAVRGT